MCDVHESDAGPGRKIESSDPRAIDIDRQVDERRAVGLLVRGDAQERNSVLDEAFIAQIVELSFPGDACQLGFQSGKIERSAEIVAEPMLILLIWCQHRRL